MMLKVVEVVGEERDEAGIDVQSGAEYLGEAMAAGGFDHIC